MKYVFDLEGDGLVPTKIYVLVVREENSNKPFITTDYEKMRSFFQKEDVTFIGHHIQRFDIPTVERLLGIKVKAKLRDTLAISWYLEPKRQKHGLDGYGIDFGVQKPIINDWLNLTIEEYTHRCVEDVDINWRLWKAQYRKLLKIYGSVEEVERFLDYIEFKIDCAREQEKSKWRLDINYAKDTLYQLELEKEDKIKRLAEVMPRVPIIKTISRPAKPFKEDGTVSAHGKRWFDLLDELGHSHDREDPVSIVADYEDPNPSSHFQIKQWLYDLGWIPRTFKYDRNKATGDIKKTPQIKNDKTGELCDSIKELFEKEPELEVLDGLSVLNHRIPMLRGFLNSADEEGFTMAQIQGMTNTMRFKHGTVVNLPKPNRPYGEQIRGSLIARNGYELCGSDQSSLEDRIKQHFIYPYDPDYVNEMNKPDFDPHLDIAVLGGMVVEADSAIYKWYDRLTNEEKAVVDDVKKAIVKKLSPIRGKAKNTNYACQYGAGPPRIALTSGMSLEESTALHRIYWERNWAIKEVAKAQIVKEVEGQKWLFNPVSKFWYSLREEKDRFSTLVQGTASYCFDIWVQYIRTKRPQLTAQFHDEIVLEIKKGNREACNKLLNWALDETNKFLGLNRLLGISIQYGDRYSDIH